MCYNENCQTLIPFCVHHTMETPKEKAQVCLPLTQYITQNHNIQNLQIVFNI